jgi:hypothetical protein
MDTYIDINQVSVTHVSLLIDLIHTGTIKAIRLGEVIAVAENDLQHALNKEDRADYRQLAALGGVAIGISEAGRKYNVPQQTISRWTKRGWIKVLGREGRKTLINEQDVAFYAHHYNLAPGQGRWAFTKSGLPRKPAA